MARKPSEMKQLTDYFCNKYEKYNRVPYLFKRLDAINLARMLKAYGLELAKAVVDEGLSGRYKLKKPIVDTNAIIYFAPHIAAQVGKTQNFIEDKIKKEEKKERVVSTSPEKIGSIIDNIFKRHGWKRSVKKNISEKP